MVDQFDAACVTVPAEPDAALHVLVHLRGIHCSFSSSASRTMGRLMLRGCFRASYQHPGCTGRQNRCARRHKCSSVHS
jgi:hypothetical protein